MLKQNLLLIIVIGLISMLSFSSSYTAPTYDSINFTLCSGYTAPTYDSINFTLGESEACDTCTCVGLNNAWEADMSDYCIINDDCYLGTGKLSFINSGNFTVAAIINTSDLGDPGNDSIIWVNSGGVINAN